ncbi:MAG: hypothetical protein HY700_01065 [Gemmatimonadetes bacterium]|nr:hypothetical protein [Gemmatimonadota bacterium]
MPKRSRTKPSTDEVQAAFQAVNALTRSELPTKPKRKRKNPAAVALGRKGGLKGGHARAASMTAKERSESARKAAKARWKQG